MTPASTSSLPSARGAVATLVLLAAVSPFVVFAVPALVGADEGYVVLSGSMEPALSPGDVVIVDATAPIRVGDIITYRDSGDSVPTTHRVVVGRDGGYETKGDANENADPGLVTPDAVVGRVVVATPLIGHVILWADTPVGYVSLVVVPLVLIGASGLLAWARRTPAAPNDPSIEPTPDPSVETPAAPATAEAETPAAAGTLSVAVVDLKLTLLAMGALFAYAGWNVYREFTVTAAPTPLSVGAFTAGLLGLVFAGSVTVAAWRAARTAEPAPAPALPDGGEVPDSGWER